MAITRALALLEVLTRVCFVYWAIMRSSARTVSSPYMAPRASADKMAAPERHEKPCLS